MPIVKLADSIGSNSSSESKEKIDQEIKQLFGLIDSKNALIAKSAERQKFFTAEIFDIPIIKSFYANELSASQSWAIFEKILKVPLPHALAKISDTNLIDKLKAKINDPVVIDSLITIYGMLYANVKAVDKDIMIKILSCLDLNTLKAEYAKKKGEDRHPGYGREILLAAIFKKIFSDKFKVVSGQSKFSESRKIFSGAKVTSVSYAVFPKTNETTEGLPAALQELWKRTSGEKHGFTFFKNDTYVVLTSAGAVQKSRWNGFFLALFVSGRRLQEMSDAIKMQDEKAESKDLVAQRTDDSFDLRALSSSSSASNLREEIYNQLMQSIDLINLNAYGKNLCTGYILSSEGWELFTKGKLPFNQALEVFVKIMDSKEFMLASRVFSHEILLKRLRLEIELNKNTQKKILDIFWELIISCEQRQYDEYESIFIDFMVCFDVSVLKNKFSDCQNNNDVRKFILAQAITQKQPKVINVEIAVMTDSNNPLRNSSADHAKNILDSLEFFVAHKSGSGKKLYWEQNFSDKNPSWCLFLKGDLGSEETWLVFEKIIETRFYLALECLFKNKKLIDKVFPSLKSKNKEEDIIASLARFGRKCDPMPYDVTKNYIIEFLFRFDLEKLKTCLANLDLPRIAFFYAKDVLNTVIINKEKGVDNFENYLAQKPEENEIPVFLEVLTKTAYNSFKKVKANPVWNKFKQGSLPDNDMLQIFKQILQTQFRSALLELSKEAMEKIKIAISNNSSDQNLHLVDLLLNALIHCPPPSRYAIKEIIKTFLSSIEQALLEEKLLEYYGFSQNEKLMEYEKNGYALKMFVLKSILPLPLKSQISVLNIPEVVLRIVCSGVKKSETDVNELEDDDAMAVDWSQKTDEQKAEEKYPIADKKVSDPVNLVQGASNAAQASLLLLSEQAIQQRPKRNRNKRKGEGELVEQKQQQQIPKRQKTEKTKKTKQKSDASVAAQKQQQQQVAQLNENSADTMEVDSAPQTVSASVPIDIPLISKKIPLQQPVVEEKATAMQIDSAAGSSSSMSSRQVVQQVQQPVIPAAAMSIANAYRAYPGTFLSAGKYVAPLLQLQMLDPFEVEACPALDSDSLRRAGILGLGDDDELWSNMGLGEYMKF